jgi:hypothetical protein
MLAEQGCDFVYGAHPLKRGMRRELQDAVGVEKSIRRRFFAQAIRR